MIRFLFILIFWIGIFFLTLEQMRDVYQDFLEKGKEIKKTFKGDFNDMQRKSKRGDKVWEHLQLLLQITLGMGSERGIRTFAIVSGLSGALTMVFLSRRVSGALVIIGTFVALSLPYGLLRIRLQDLRVRGSHEGELLLTELLDNYKINFSNMQKAIEATVLTIEDAPVCRKLLFNLSKGLNRVGSEQDLIRLLRELKLSLNTSWGNILVTNLYFSLLTGMEVSEALGDLSNTISKARKVEEYSKRENNEAKLILRYLVPISYVLTIVGGEKYFGITYHKFFHYQFGTEVGLTWFTISCLLYITGLLLKSFLSKTTLDF